MDKSWMKKSRGTTEYNDGCKSFVAFAVSSCRTHVGLIYCPCKSCRNNHQYEPGYVLAHLTGGKIMIPNYNTWIMPSEKHARYPDASTSSNPSAAGGSIEQGDDMHAMLRDAFDMHRVKEGICDPEVMVQRLKKQLNVTY